MVTLAERHSARENARWLNTAAYYLSFVLLGMGGAGLIIEMDDESLE